MFIWAVKDARMGPPWAHLRLADMLSGQINWISESLTKALANLPANLNVSVHIHITRGVTDIESIDWSLQDESESASVDTNEKSSVPAIPSILESPLVKIMIGRPDIQKALKDQMDRDCRRMGVSGA